MSPPTAYRPDIDGLRAVAVLAVVVHHAAPDSLRAGFVGVDIFFVISGFLITRIVRDDVLAERFSYLDFYGRRIRRLVPALVLVLGTTWLLGAAVLTGPEFFSLGRHLTASGLFASNLLLYREVGYFDSEAGAKPLLHLWSLGVEEQFYLLWPALVILATRRPRLAPWLLLATGTSSVLVSAWTAVSDPPFAFFLLPARLWELLAGGLIAVGATRPEVAAARLWLGERTVRVLREALAWSGVTLLAVSFARITDALPYPGTWAALPVASTVAFIAAGPDALVNRAVLGHPVSVALGRISYPLYLWHWPLLSLLAIVGPDLGVADGRSFDPNLVAAAVAVLLAWLTYRFVEQPIQRDAATRLATGGSPRRPLLGLASLLLAVVILGAGTAAFHGLPGRYAGPLAGDEIAVLAESSRRRAMSHVRGAIHCTDELPDARPEQCLRSLKSPARVVLLGDSHAESAFPGFAQALPDVSVQVISHTRCPPLVGVAIETDFTQPACSAVMEAALRALTRSTTVQTVLLISRGPLYVTSGDDYVRSAPLDRPTADALYSADSTRLALFRDGLRRTAERLAAGGKQVVLLHDVPELGFRPRDCVVGRPLGIRAPIAPCQIDRAAVDARNADYRRTLLAVAAEVAGTHFFDSIPVFCNEEHCPVMEPDGRLRYADDNA